ncbi:odorant receptor 13a-like [Haematobia irritans]|uniref:odorant receptor 13a-like n=1 Tax=Haematobia irritans TaxID=7368 RepID=UPI003F506896
MSSGVTLYNIMPIVVILKDKITLESPNKPLPFFMLFPFDHQKPHYYFSTFLWCIYIGYITILQSCSMDMIFAQIVSFTCGQFEILHGRLARLIPMCYAEWQRGNLNPLNDKKENLKYLQLIYNRHLDELSRDHSDLLSFCLELENLYAFPLMVNMVVSSLVISFGGFQLVSGQNSPVDFIRFLLYLASVTIQLYAVCYLGSLLIYMSTKTARYLAMSNWEGGLISQNSPLLDESEVMETAYLNQRNPLWQHIDYPLPNITFRRKLDFMILRSNRPAKLTAMKFADISLETFNQIISSSASFFALLKSFMDRIN